jgi:hypothetical protein
MKTISSIGAVFVLSLLTAFGQGGGGGRVNFNNFYVGPNPIFVDNGGGPAVYAGSDYSIQLSWAVGTYTNQAVFDSLNPTQYRLSIIYDGGYALPNASTSERQHRNRKRQCTN